ncbi:UDP-glucose 4-epimerase GalE [Marinimicrobium sp. C2-29]|uniref:UDP-glucose 4-epimerase GalE n=1 Tax=Marinimicrobium sp. C2-29 TaxID=3139825 RepID=UPI003139BD4C
MPEQQQVLVTGGAGYIGSHVCVSLIEAGFTPVVVDNYSNSHEVALDRVTQITGVRPPVYAVDIRDEQRLGEVFAAHDIKAVMHFAGLKAVGESTTLPLEYHGNNVGGSITLFRVMEQHNVRKLIFSSSATVYGDPASVPIKETFPCQVTNPYGRTKLIVEDILRDMSAAPDAQWNTTLLRYFNPVGAHESGLIGEDPAGIPNNLVPFIAQVAVGNLPYLKVFGSDYDTRDGTGVRDYIHVVDLAAGHVAALEQLFQVAPECRVYNLGTGTGYSVLEVVKAFSEASGLEIPYELAPRRPGDIAQCFADPELAWEQLGWRTRRDLKQMMEDTWRWQKRNPQGYRTSES